MTPWRRVALGAAIAAPLGALTARAAAPERVLVYADGWYASIDGTGRIDGASAGTPFDLSRDVGIGGRTRGYEAGAWFHPAGRHRVRAAVARLTADGSKTLARPTSFGGAVVPPGTPVSSSVELRVLQADYAWSFVNLDIASAAVVAGADGIDGEVRSGPEGSLASARPRGIVPVVGLTALVQPAPYVRLDAEAVFGRWNARGFEGRLRDLGVRVEFYVARIFGLGFGYRDLRVRAEGSSEGLLDAHANGFQTFLLFRL